MMKAEALQDLGSTAENPLMRWVLVYQRAILSVLTYTSA